MLNGRRHSRYDPSNSQSWFRQPAAIIKSPMYWGILLFAIAPILIEATRLNMVVGMLIYFSLFWFFLFRPLVATSTPRRSWLVDILAYVFTATIGVMFAYNVEGLWVSFGAESMLASHNLALAVPTFVVVVGVTEEFAKQIFILIALLIVRVRRLATSPLEFMIMGVSSGLGFSAVENISYVHRGLMNEVVHHVVGAGLVTALSRALYTPFLHGVWAGIAAFGFGLVAQRGISYLWAALALLAFSAIGHGFYDATISSDVLWALIDVAVSYLLFLLLLVSGLRRRQAYVEI